MPKNQANSTKSNSTGQKADRLTGRVLPPELEHAADMSRSDWAQVVVLIDIAMTLRDIRTLLQTQSK